MAYIDRSSNTRRTTTAIAVAAIQAGAIYAVVTGLAVDFVTPPKKDSPLKATSFTPTVPDKPKEEAKRPVTPEKTVQEKAQQVTPRDVQIIPPRDTDLTGIKTGLDELGTGTGTGTGTEFVKRPDPTPTPMASPRMAKPRNAPASWATSNDYPSRDLREGNQGVTRFRLSIGSDGKVLGCEILASSGSASLDSTTCDKVSRRARFEPATDGYGNSVPGTYSSNVRWQIPN